MWGPKKGDYLCGRSTADGHFENPNWPKKAPVGWVPPTLRETWHWKPGEKEAKEVVQSAPQVVEEERAEEERVLDQLLDEGFKQAESNCEVEATQKYEDEPPVKRAKTGAGKLTFV